MPIFGDGHQIRAFSYIGDVAPPIARAPLVPEARDEIINEGADDPHAILEPAEALADVLGARCDVIHHPARLEVAEAVASHEKARRIFGPIEPVELREGLPLMCDVVRETERRLPVAFSEEIEAPVRMPPAGHASRRVAGPRATRPRQ